MPGNGLKLCFEKGCKLGLTVHDFFFTGSKVYRREEFRVRVFLFKGSLGEILEVNVWVGFLA